MAKGRGANSSDVQGVQQQSRITRAKRGDPPDAFVQALADALRDILRDEQRARAA